MACRLKRCSKAAKIHQALPPHSQHRNERSQPLLLLLLGVPLEPIFLGPQALKQVGTADWIAMALMIT
jgi:hypothetical protein